MYRTILVPIDGSAAAVRGLREAIRLAHGQRSRLVVLHVIAAHEYDEFLGVAPPTPGVVAILRENGRALVDRAVALARRRGVAAKAVVAQRPGLLTAQAIVHQAKAQGAGLIVMGTHGRRGIRRLVLGSDAEQVVRLSPVPVMLVRAARGR